MLGHGLVFLLHFCQALSLLVSPGFLENAHFSQKKTQEFHMGSPTACQSAHLGRKNHRAKQNKNEWGAKRVVAFEVGKTSKLTLR